LEDGRDVVVRERSRHVVVLRKCGSGCCG
jgi:hypothetical protein